MLRCLILAVLAMVPLAGCALSPKPAPEFPPPGVDARALPMLDGRSGRSIAWNDLIAAAAGADAVLIGELHGQSVGQAFQAAFFEDVLAAAPTAAAALEFYERDHQAAMDDYLDGVINPHEFRRLTDRNSGDDTPGHRTMIQLCKANNRPVIAANAPRRYVKLARTDGYERLAKLGPEQRRLYRLPDSVPAGPYRDAFFELMRPSKKDDAAHATEDESRMEAMFRAQTLWDWTMADSVARALDQTTLHGERAAPARPVVLVVGRFHTDSDGGLVQALRAIRPETKIFTISFEARERPPAADDRADVADVIVFVGEEGEGA